MDLQSFLSRSINSINASSVISAMPLLPDLPDMMHSGMGLTEALAFWNQMMNSSNRTPEYWWAQLRKFADPQTGPTLQ